jgi:hypothetical protein
MDGWLGCRCGSAAAAPRYRVRARNRPRRVTGHEQHAHHHKDEVIVSATKAIITRFFVVVAPQRRTNHSYCLYFTWKLDGAAAGVEFW